LGTVLQETRVRLHALDALRGLAALSVMLWHWQHFQLLGTRRLTWSNATPALNHSLQPFFLMLSVFYAHGFIAVDLFPDIGLYILLAL
jgi:peptidoglycan/LPS O-acetylase OafA/YrhL